MLRRLVKVALLLVVVVAVVFGVTAARVWQVSREDHRAVVDAIVVLGASQYDGRPSAVFRRRLDHAAELWESHVAPRVVTVGGSREGDRFTEASSGVRYLRDRAGVPESALFGVPEGNDTVSSLHAAARLLDEHGWRRVVLVTDPWHSLRSRRIARDEGLDARTSPARAEPGNERELRYVARETVAYIYYRLFHS